MNRHWSHSFHLCFSQLQGGDSGRNKQNTAAAAAVNSHNHTHTWGSAHCVHVSDCYITLRHTHTHTRPGDVFSSVFAEWLLDYYWKTKSKMPSPERFSSPYLICVLWFISSYSYCSPSEVKEVQQQWWNIHFCMCTRANLRYFQFNFKTLFHYIQMNRGFNSSLNKLFKNPAGWHENALSKSWKQGCFKDICGSQNMMHQHTPDSDCSNMNSKMGSTGKSKKKS